MFTPLVLATLMAAPAQPGGLSLVNIAPTYGILGPTRPNTSLLPGDVLCVRFDIDGITIGKDGKVTYTMQQEVLDGAGKVSVFKPDAVNRVDQAPLGGGRLPGYTFVTAGLDLKPGDYLLKMTVTDNANKATKSFEQKFTVQKPDFGIVAVYASSDNQGRLPAPTTGVVGGSIFLHFSAVGFQKDATKKQPDLVFEMVPVENGKPTAATAAVWEVKDGVDEKDGTYSMRYPMPFTRPGKFAVRLTATDKITKKVATLDVPVTVLPADK
jgi:hypothetical protein